MAKLIVIDGPDIGTEYELPTRDAASEPITVGRDPEAFVALNDPAVSREHFRLEPVARGFRLIDLGSRNRTFVNGLAARETVLENEDRIRVGDTEFRLESDREMITADGVVSTIIKELPTATGGDTIVKRLGLLERTLGDERRRQALESIDRLFKLYGNIAGTSSVRELCGRLLAEIGPALEADHVAALLPVDGAWVVQARYPDDEASAPSALASHSIVTEVASQRKAILFSQAPEDEHLREQDSILGAEIVTAIAAPVTAGERTLAVLYADRRGKGAPFSDDELQLLAAAAQPAGPLLEGFEEREQLQQENRNLFRTLSEGRQLIGRSEAMQTVFAFVEKAAPTPMTVLIQGETGTGKELVASAIHFASPRRGRPFVALNCAALPDNLAESELFGHERGAFTGAVARRKGRFELAHTGTVFLDEVGELSLACQGKLLRLLEERKFERVGGAEPISVDVRIIAATNRDLLGGVGEGTFREDLYYRLSVLNVLLPPLRQRLDDLPLLVEHFLAESSGGAKRLAKAALKALKAYPWPGNIRQLRNTIESAVVLSDGAELAPEDLVLPQARAAGGGGGFGSDTEPWEPTSLSAVEKKHIARVLEHTGGNKKKAAEILGIERCTLYAKIKSYEIQP